MNFMYFTNSCKNRFCTCDAYHLLRKCDWCTRMSECEPLSGSSTQLQCSDYLVVILVTIRFLHENTWIHVISCKNSCNKIFCKLETRPNLNCSALKVMRVAFGARNLARSGERCALWLPRELSADIDPSNLMSKFGTTNICANFGMPYGTPAVICNV